MSELQNPFVQSAFQHWLEVNPDGREQLIAAGIKPGHIKNLENGDCPENIMFPFASDLERVTGLNLKDIIFQGAKQMLWSDEDRLPEVASHQAMLDQLATMRASLGSSFLAHEVGLKRTDTLNLWIRGQRIATERVKVVLKIILKHLKPQVFTSLYKGEETKTTSPSRKVSGGSHAAARQVINATITVLNAQLNVLRTVLEDHNAILDGDRMNVLSTINRLLDLFHIDDEFMTRSGQVNPITAQDTVLRSLVGGLGRRKQ